MDLLMGSFADTYLGSFSEAQLAEYEALLELADPDLYNCITGAAILPATHDGEVARLLCKHRFAS